MTQITITKDIAQKVLAVVDQGLSSGMGRRKKGDVQGEMCVEAAVCYALGLPHGDDPECVSPALRQLKISLNDKNWSSKEARAKGLRRLAVAQLGSKGHLDDKEFAKRVAKLAITHSVPVALRAAASICKDAKHKQAMLDAANRCEKEGTKQSARDARTAAADAAYAAAADAAYAAAYAAAADAAYAAAYAAADAASAAAAADAAADAASAAAAADATDAKRAARDKALADFAEGVVQILIEMGAPGCQWLELTEAA